MRRLGPVAWLSLAVISALLLGAARFVAVFASGLDIAEACEAAGQPFDVAYRDALMRQSEERWWLPMHTMCNAHYDLVPAWVNPASVVLSLLVMVCMGAAVWSAVSRLKARRGTS
ncbi:hypothetical protein NX801_21580 [Streptomyces sp. LP05-1]|uniref:Integral membrane protein n=1 Tax=Streptomyces pyxinae TaxID=2970734 RepID=A0ABT2CLA0_9ACTN|nr:hypothetical protein [Streptomyces sp. LP05-1]MCS0638198.1 hypothetical protein [Streptomyces sp. LP05-1]